MSMLNNNINNTILDKIPNFTESFNTSIEKLKYDRLSNDQKNLLTSFKKYPVSKKTEPFYFNNNSDYATVYLQQKDFDNGTVRLKNSCRYVLIENIIFHPNPANDFKPTPEQINSGLYPIPGSYNLGFFAAITLENKNAILDLNNCIISQSTEHFLMQRFYAHIEVASAPFINNQGPSAGITENHRAADNVAIINGCFDLSSHHAVHGNGARNLLLSNLKITQFQVAGIALNGLRNAIINDVIINGSMNNVPVLSTYSQAIFTLPFIKKLATDNECKKIYVNGKTRTAPELYTELKDAIENTRREILDTGKTSDPLFENKHGGSDTNIYGMLLNVLGVAINGFLSEVPENRTKVGNEDINLQNITIINICSNSAETVGLVDRTMVGEQTDCYGRTRPRCTGVVGGLFQHVECTDTRGRFKPNILAEVQAILGLHTNNGTIYFTRNIIDWIEGKIVKKHLLERMYVEEEYGLDSMGHVMKGNIGLFIQGGKNISGENILVSNIQNNGKIPKRKGQKTTPQGGKSIEIAIVVPEEVIINEVLYNKTYMRELN